MLMSSNDPVMSNGVLSLFYLQTLMTDSHCTVWLLDEKLMRVYFIITVQ